MKLPDHTIINEHAIKLVEGKGPLYSPIYSQSLIDLGTLKTYIETHLKTGFIYSFKFFARAPILFDKKLDGSLYLYINFWRQNNQIIKNCYSLSLIGESLHKLEQVKQFSQLNLISAYHRITIKENNE